MLGIVLAAAVGATPSPQPTPQLKIILNERSSTFCTAMKDTAVPIAYVVSRNEQAFAVMNQSMLKVAGSLRAFSSQVPNVL